MDFQDWIEVAGSAVEAAGVIAIVMGVVLALVFAVTRLLRRQSGVYGRFRRFLARSILLGLELLVAADIIRTVAVGPTLEGVGVLALVVLIRTFLSWALELEITGRWPWQHGQGWESTNDSNSETL
ncbi:DUF1622 domain-containing protein [Cryobacterium sp. CG_9.6]|uniref:DUF1622 domain-containing protein n=1 Tax=Cryobacterium sp. CG_9.6 TaxID=2760710 RepID=UPI0024763AEE|nr:DUF1622 domain-containing protein [Cryobacterium sp. CG_9.6]MDH6238165.1 putative membrane protein [Cryobacterium sp. CG_9.6]